jgi:hypothetical protein
MISVSRNRRGRSLSLGGCRAHLAILVVLFGATGAAEAIAQSAQPVQPAQPVQTTDATMRTAARELATQGAEAFERADYKLAYDRLTRAFSLYPVPSISIMQARALVHLGRLVEAADRYEETRRMPLAEDAPEAFRAAAREAAVEVEQVRALLPRLVIHVKATSDAPKGMTVTLDGKVLPAALLEVDCPVDPGEHVVTLRATNRPPASHKVKVAEKERLAIELTVAAAPQMPNTDNGQALTRVEPTTDASRKWWGFGAMGGGAVALLGSVITGKSALDKKDYLDRVCHPACPAGTQGDIDSFRTNRTISYATAGVSLALVGVGGYLLLTGERAGRNSAIGVSPNGVTWGGRF